MAGDTIFKRKEILNAFNGLKNKPLLKSKVVVS